MSTYQLKLIPIEKACEITGLIESSYMERIHKDNAPRPIKMSIYGKTPARSTASRFILSEVEAYAKRKIAESRATNPYTPTPEPGQKLPALDLDQALKQLKAITNVIENSHYSLSLIPTMANISPASYLVTEFQSMIAALIPLVKKAAHSLNIDANSVGGAA